jgi:cytochrome c-type biogenesis protein CcmE
LKFGKMKAHRRNRLLLVLLLVLSAGGATTFAMLALNENINLFYSPEQIASGQAPQGKVIRAGGMVVEGSVQRSETDLGVSFVISDLKASNVRVEFSGILPDLFREGQGVIALGVLNANGAFVAEEVLAKHDEEYMPAELADILEEAHEGANVDPYGKGSYGRDSYGKDSYSKEYGE